MSSIDIKAPATLRAYANDWRAFEAYCAERGLSTMPASSAAVTAFLLALVECGKKRASAQRAFYAITYAHREAGHVPDWVSREHVRGILAELDSYIAAHVVMPAATEKEVDNREEEGRLREREGVVAYLRSIAAQQPYPAWRDHFEWLAVAFEQGHHRGVGNAQ